MRPQPSDKDILKELTEGRKQEIAFSKLVKKYQENLYWVIRRLVKSHEAADDVLQNTWVKIWKNRNKFRKDAALYTWMYRIATNEAYTFLNTAYQRKFTPTDDPLVTSTSHQEISGEKIESILLAAIEKLPEKQQIVFQMKYFDELKFKEISDKLDTSIGALKASYHHAVKKIEVFINDELNL